MSSFSNKTEQKNIVILDLEIETQKKNLLEEIEKLSTIRDDLQKSIDNKKEEKKVIAKIKKSSDDYLVEFKEKKIEMDKELKEKKSELDEMTSRVLSLGEKLAQSKSYASKLELDLVTLKQLTDDLRKEEKQMNALIVSLEEDVRKSLVSKKTELSGLESLCVDKRSELLDLVKKVSIQEEKFSLESERHKIDVESLLEKRELLSKEVEMVEVNLTTKRNKLISEVNSLEKHISEVSELSSKQMESLAEREGLVSTKESWLLEKENTLRGIKDELQKYYNKPIPVNI